MHSFWGVYEILCELISWSGRVARRNALLPRKTATLAHETNDPHTPDVDALAEQLLDRADADSA